jgi:hypothetical protein
MDTYTKPFEAGHLVAIPTQKTNLSGATFKEFEASRKAFFPDAEYGMIVTLDQNTADVAFVRSTGLASSPCLFTFALEDLVPYGKTIPGSVVTSAGEYLRQELETRYGIIIPTVDSRELASRIVAMYTALVACPLADTIKFIRTRRYRHKVKRLVRQEEPFRDQYTDAGPKLEDILDNDWQDTRPHWEYPPNK